MSSASKWPVLLLAALLLISLWGVANLFVLRFEQGDIYPPYSTLRTDPLGARAFYEALESVPELRVRRHYQPLTQLEERSPVTLFYLAEDPYMISGMDVLKSEMDKLRAIAEHGGRVVLTFLPAQSDPQSTFWGSRSEMETETNEDGDAEKDDATSDTASVDAQTSPIDQSTSPPQAEFMREAVSFAEYLNVELDYNLELLKDREQLITSATLHNDYRESMESGAEPDLPSVLSWHSALNFKAKDPEWRTVYESDGKPVMIEQRIGSGTLVLSADSYFLSNEAMRADRKPRLLAWLMGSQQRAIFDEHHFGIQESPGVMTLVNRLRLQGFLFALLIVAGLFIWRSAFSLVPTRSPGEERMRSSYRGREALEGLINLLQRHVSARTLLATCYEEWKKLHPRPPRHLQRKIEEMQRIMRDPELQGDPVERYRQMSRVLRSQYRGTEYRNQMRKRT